MTPITELLNTKEVAKLLCVSPRTVESWRQQEVGPPFVRISATAVRYRAEDLAAWLDQLVTPNPIARS